MGRSPLDHPRLSIIDRKLDEGELEEAQHLLAQLGDNYFFRHATTYLASRLLYLRGTLDQDGLVERLVRVLNETHEFPEAEALLALARSGTLERTSHPPRSSRPPPAKMTSQPPGAEVELAFSGRVTAEDRKHLVAPEFPRAGRLPDLAVARASDPIPDLEVPGSVPPPPLSDEQPAPRSAPRPDRMTPAARPDRMTPAAQPDRVTPAARPDRMTPAHRPNDLTLELHERKVHSKRSQPNPDARYSSPTGLEERIQLTRKPQANSPAFARPDARCHTEPLVGSGGPAKVEARASLFEIATLLDAGRADAALEALSGRSDADEPDHALLRARALARQGQTLEALALARRLGHAPLLDPTVRAGVARLAIELDEIELGLEQAVLAHEDDPTQPTISLTYAWAALRRARRTADPELVARASMALRELVGDGGPHEGLLLALRACAEAHAGDPTRALSLAERSIESEPSADGHAALAMAAARLGRPNDVKRATGWLKANCPKEAAALQKSLDAYGERLFDLSSAPHSIHAPAINADLEASILWGPLELAVCDGDWHRVWETFAQLAADTFEQISTAARHEPPALAAVAASFLTVAPVSRDLAPYDQTPWSLRRVADLLALLARGASGVRATHPLALLLGAYVGETLRMSVDGHWQGPTSDPVSREIMGSTGVWRPCSLVAESLAGKSDLAAAAAVAELEGNLHSLAAHLPAVTPICPWDPAQWPAPSRLPHYAKALEQSVISVLCAGRSGHRLDGSVASLLAIDEHLERICPRAAPPQPDARWSRRATVLIGAYLGETLRRETPGEWSRRDGLDLGPSSYRLVLSTGRELRPVEHVFERLNAGADPLHEYALRSLG